jgi:uncharacterized Zn finger protein (UPF0148 family)
MGGRDHSCEVCGRGGFNDPDGRCVCPTSPPSRQRNIGIVEDEEQA